MDNHNSMQCMVTVTEVVSIFVHYQGCRKVIKSWSVMTIVYSKELMGTYSG